ncbi:MAG TPA: YihY/virulence factor BrkB family protein [Chthoniobacterales bacterium]|jgi:membrane protein|nr:YihY/virulence factor BrkB family protein [Chthoniobacterales bacterium]
MANETKLQSAWALTKNSAIEWWNDNTFRLSASLAFYTIFSIAPVVLIAVGAASLFFERQTAVNEVVHQVQNLAGPQGADAIRTVLQSSAGLGNGAWAITVGLVTLFLGASVVFAELQSALNQVWNVKVQVRHGFVLDYLLDRLRSFTIALVVGFLLLVSLVLSAALSALQDYMTNWMPRFPWLWQGANIVVSLIIVALLFAMIYKYLPDVRIGWRDVWIGAAVTSILFNGGKYLIGLYLGQAAIGSAFGAAGSFAVLLVWIYYSALISFFGAEFTQVYARRHGRKIEPEGHARPAKKNEAHA